MCHSYPGGDKISISLLVFVFFSALFLYIPFESSTNSINGINAIVYVHFVSGNSNQVAETYSFALRWNTNKMNRIKLIANKTFCWDTSNSLCKMCKRMLANGNANDKVHQRTWIGTNQLANEQAREKERESKGINGASIWLSITVIVNFQSNKIKWFWLLICVSLSNINFPSKY